MRKLFLVGSLFLGVAAAIPKLAVSAPSCPLKTVGTGIVQKVKPVVNVAYGKDSYQFAIASTNRGDVPVVLRKSNNSCYLSFSDPGGDATTLSVGVPRPVAKALSLALLKKDIAERGKSVVQNSINQTLGIAPEYALAIKAAGLNLPTNAKILPWAEKGQEIKLR
ncbi:MAG: hypothetical protein ACRCYP_01745 [Alphaproteobacteria bacterium]